MKKKQEHFNFLEALRKSGITNMYGAADYLQAYFPRDFRSFEKAQAVLVEWIKFKEAEASEKGGSVRRG